MSRSNILQWIGALAVSTAIVVPTSLNRKHHVSHHLSVRVFAAVIVALGVAVIFRLLFWGGGSLYRRLQGGQPGEASS